MSLRIKKLNKSFGDNQVLKDLDMELSEGEVYCLMGPSGMGKTTLLRILLGLEKKDSGLIEGMIPEETTAMFQEDRLCPELTAIENVALVCRKKVKMGEIRRSLEEILPPECLEQPVKELSGGMKRRVALARALYEDKRLTILDEPFTGLDSKTRREVMSYLLKQQRGRTLLIATHGEGDAACLGAQVIDLGSLMTVHTGEGDI